MKPAYKHQRNLFYISPHTTHTFAVWLICCRGTTSDSSSCNNDFQQWRRTVCDLSPPVYGHHRFCWPTVVFLDHQYLRNCPNPICLQKQSKICTPTVYNLVINGGCAKCKSFFMKTLFVSNRAILTAFAGRSDSGSFASTDGRGRQPSANRTDDAHNVIQSFQIINSQNFALTENPPFHSP